MPTPVELATIAPVKAIRGVPLSVNISDRSQCPFCGESYSASANAANGTPLPQPCAIQGCGGIVPLPGATVVPSIPVGNFGPPPVKGGPG